MGVLPASQCYGYDSEACGMVIGRWGSQRSQSLEGLPQRTGASSAAVLSDRTVAIRYNIARWLSNEAV